MQKIPDVGDAADRAALVRAVMRPQARLGLRVAAVFVLVLVGLPLLNLYLPETMGARVGGFTLTWLLLAVLFYPVTWLLSWLFVSGSDRLEASIVREMRGRMEALGDRSISDRGVRVTENDSTTKRKLFVEEDEA